MPERRRPFDASRYIADMVDRLEREYLPYTWGVDQHPLNAIDTTGRDVTGKRPQQRRPQLESGPR